MTISAILHGIPGNATVKTQHQIRLFQDTIDYKIVGCLGMDGARQIGYTTGQENKPLRPTEHTLEFRFTHHDGSIYHYTFTGKIDGI